MNARVRGVTEVRDFPKEQTAICYHCRGTLKCGCAICGKDGDVAGKCVACLGAGRLAWPSNESSRVKKPAEKRKNDLWGMVGVLIMIAALSGCAAHHDPPPVVPPPVVSTYHPDMEAAVQRMAAHGYRVEPVGPEFYDLQEIEAEDTNNGKPCFYAEGYITESERAAALEEFPESWKDGHFCAQGYTNPNRFPVLILILKEAPVTHEFLHLLFWLNFSGRQCPDGVGLQADWIEHGAKRSGVQCDPFAVSEKTKETQ